MSNIDWKILSQVIKVPPQAWDFIFPHGPANHLREGSGLRPESAEDLGASLGASLVLELWTGAVISAGGDSGSVGKQFLFEIEDWCGTMWPRWRPKPKGPRPWDDRAIFLGAAVAAAVLADSFDHNPEAQEVLGAAAERLAGQVQRMG